ncbi:hypothetical protein V6N13_013267 [Hibiscus sabdariffa]
MYTDGLQKTVRIENTHGCSCHALLPRARDGRRGRRHTTSHPSSHIPQENFLSLDHAKLLDEAAHISKTSDFSFSFSFHLGFLQLLKQG